MGRRCAIFGASGGIGNAFVKALAADPDVETVYALSRKAKDRKGHRIVPVVFDLTDEASIQESVSRIASDGPLDLVIVATGVLQRDPDVAPEKTWRSLDPAAMAENFHINTIGPALIGKYVLEHLRGEGRPVFAAISARVGSIEDNGFGGWHSYRASKAALNQIIRNFAIELGRRNKGAIAVSLHPGTVQTSLSAPFSANVPEGKLFSPDFSVRSLLSVIGGLEPTDSGGFYAWDGKPIPF